MQESEQSQVFQPSKDQVELQSHSQIFPKPRVQRSNILSIQGKWDQEQNIQYVAFMDYHSDVFSSKTKRKNLKIFKTLSIFLNSRTPRQCRSHFQKLMNRFKSFKKIIFYYQNLLGIQKYKAALQSVTDKIKSVNANKTQTTKQQKIQTSKNFEIGTQTEFPDLLKQYVCLFDRMRMLEEQNAKYEWMLRLSMSLPSSFHTR